MKRMNNAMEKKVEAFVKTNFKGKIQIAKSGNRTLWIDCVDGFCATRFMPVGTKFAPRCIDDGWSFCVNENKGFIDEKVYR